MSSDTKWGSPPPPLSWNSRSGDPVDRGPAWERAKELRRALLDCAGEERQFRTTRSGHPEIETDEERQAFAAELGALAMADIAESLRQILGGSTR